MKGQKLKEKDLENKLHEFIKINYPDIDNYEYNISPDNETIRIIFKHDFSDSDKILKNIEEIDTLLNTKFISIESINGVTTFIHKFNTP